MSDPQVLTSLEHALLRSDRTMALTITSLGQCVFIYILSQILQASDTCSIEHVALHVHNLLDTSDSAWLSLK